MARNRVIYQSEAVFVSPNSTGAHFICNGVLTGKGGPGVNEWHSAVMPISPIGLAQDPQITKNFDSTPGIGYSASPGEFDLVNISGAAKAAMQAVGSTFNLTQSVNGTAAAQGNVTLFTKKSSFDTFADTSITAAGGASTTGVMLQPAISGDYENLVQQIHRVQSANYSFSINRTDVNTFGQLARIDAIALEPPTVNLDFTYYPTDGFNERNLGFYIQGAANKGVGMGAAVLNAASGHLQDDGAGRNFFILTTPEGTDAFNTTRKVSERSVISLGNGFLSDYSMDASVGSIPSVSSTVELFNAKSDIGTTGKEIPAVTLDDGKPVTGINFSLGHHATLRGDDQGAAPSTGDVTATALRPGDIELQIPTGLSIFSDVSGDGSVHIQNFSLSLPLSRSPIDRLGTRFAFSRVVDFPVVATMSVSALVSEVNEANLAKIIDACDEYDVKVKMKANQSCGVGEAVDSMIIDFKGARIDSESISSDIGSNKSVDLSFTTQIGGPEDKLHGVFISGANRVAIPDHVAIPRK